MSSCLKSKSGFTLIEMVIAVAVFSIVLLTIMQIFITITRAQQKSSAALEAQAEARYALETLTRKIKSSYIFYDHYKPLTPSHPELSLVDTNNNGTVFLLQSGVPNCSSLVSSPCLKMLVDTNGFATSTQSLTGEGIKITNLEFLVSPQTDPFVPDFDPATGSQPKATIAMTIESVGGPASTIYLQTTISTRYYER